MKPRHAIPILFLLAILVLPLASSLVARAEAGVIPLNFVDSSYDAIPGYRIPVFIHAEAERNLVQYGFAGAAVKVGNLEVGYTADPPGWGGLGSMSIYFYAKKDNNYIFKKKIDTIGYNGGKHGYDTSIIIFVDCNGKITINTDYGEVTSTIPNDGCTPIDIYEQTGRVDAATIHLASNVRYGSPTKIEDCGCNNGNLPHNGDGSGGNTIGGSNNNSLREFVKELAKLLNKTALLGIGVVAVLGLLMVARR